MSEYDKFVNNFMSNLTEKEKMQSPLSNMAMATQAWRETQQKPISQRVVNRERKQETELTTLGFGMDFTLVKHIDLGLTSSLQGMFPQLPSCHLKKHLTDANGELDEAIDSILLETQTQENSCPELFPGLNDAGNACMYNSIENTENNDVEEMLCQMFPQYPREGICCTLRSCGGSLYDSVEILLKLLPKENRSQPPRVITFSQSATTAVNNIPNSSVNPFAVALASSSGKEECASRKCHFCKKCGHQVPPSANNLVAGYICPNPTCGYPLPQNIRM